ncbi:hypothetical protein PtB15_2B241 [Puccinia triticina]|nr:hypothetical protein PtB15_2B241 [Puccinia triticina]
MALVGHILQVDSSIELARFSQFGDAGELANHSNINGCRLDHVNIDSPEGPFPNVSADKIEF